MSEVIHLPPADCSGSARRGESKVRRISVEFARWKRTPDYRSWRSKQWARQNACCYYCLCDLRIVRVNIEHIIPRSRGGTNHHRNLVLACSSCNKQKGSSLLPEGKRRKLHQRSLSQSKRARSEFRQNNDYQEQLAQQLSWIK